MIFGGPPKRITKEEFKRALARVDVLNQDEKKDLWLIFAGDMDESGNFAGIDSTELAKRISWMTANLSKHSLDPNEIAQLHTELKKFI